MYIIKVCWLYFCKYFLDSEENFTSDNHRYLVMKMEARQAVLM